MRIRSVAFSLFVTVALALAAASFAFVAGRQAADAPSAYDKGAADGERLGRSQARADLVPGTASYDRIFNRGMRIGYARGHREGMALGRQRGEAAAKDAPFDGFPGGWDVGSWYLVSIAPGQDGGRYALGGRMLARPGRVYRVCAGGARVCESVAPAPRRRASRARADAAQAR